MAVNLEKESIQRSSLSSAPEKMPSDTTKHIAYEPAPQEQGADIDVSVVQFVNSNRLFVVLLSALYILIGHFLPTLLGLAFPDAIGAEECVAVVNACRILLMWIGSFGVFVSVWSYTYEKIVTHIARKER